MDTLGIEPNTSRKSGDLLRYMLSERDNQLHHVPVHKLDLQRNVHAASKDPGVKVVVLD